MSSGRCYPDDEKTRHFKAAADSGLRGEHAYVEVRYDDETRTTVDEICTTQIHLERMDYDNIWMSVNGLHVHLYVKGRRGREIVVTVEPHDCTPYVVKPGEGTLEGPR